MRTRNKPIPIRATEKELEVIDRKAEKAKISRTDYMIAASIGKEISVVGDLKPILSELKRIGNNLNQLTTLAHMGKVSEVNLTETNESLGRIYDEIYRLARQKRGENNGNRDLYQVQIRRKLNGIGTQSRD